MKRSLPDRLFSLAVLAPFAAAIVYLHYRQDVSLDTFIYGSGSWGFGCILKIILYQGIVRRLPHDSNHIRRVSALNGFVSGITELGLALLFFTFMPALTLWDIVGFGVGIGAIEAFVVATTTNPLKGTALEKAAAELEAVVARMPAGQRFVYGYLLPFAERLIAGVIHVGTRGLVYVAYRSVNPLPFVIALAVFFVADGVLGYRLIHEGKLAEIRVLNLTYAALAFIAAIAIVCFLLFWSGGIGSARDVSASMAGALPFAPRAGAPSRGFE